MRDNLTINIKTKDNLDTVKVELEINPILNGTIFRWNSFKLHKQTDPNISYEQHIKEIYN